MASLERISINKKMQPRRKLIFRISLSIRLTTTIFMINSRNLPPGRMYLSLIMWMKFFTINSALLPIEDHSNLCNCFARIITSKIKILLESNPKHLSQSILLKLLLNNWETFSKFFAKIYPKYLFLFWTSS